VFGIHSLEGRIEGLGFRVQGVGMVFMFKGRGPMRFRIQDLGFSIPGFEVYDLN
jgi:hypothetical protein